MAQTTISQRITKDRYHSTIINKYANNLLPLLLIIQESFLSLRKISNDMASNKEKKSYDPFEPHKIFSLNRIAKLAGINNDRLYNNAKGSRVSKALTDDEKSTVKKIIIDAQKDFFELLD